MVQKTIWMPFLIIGISSTILLQSCNDKIVESIKDVSYVYENKTDINLVMEVYNQSKSLIQSFNIVSGEKIISNTTKLEGAIPFYFDSEINSIGDSVVVKFSSSKCLFYSKLAGDRIFSISSYDNFSEELVKKNEFELIYSFKQSDLNQALDCN